MEDYHVLTTVDDPDYPPDYPVDYPVYNYPVNHTVFGDLPAYWLRQLVMYPLGAQTAVAVEDYHVLMTDDPDYPVVGEVERTPSSWTR